MNVSRSGYYKWLSRKGKLNNYQKNRESLKEQIKKVHKKHSTYGYRHIAHVIRNETGELFSDLLCHKLCKELNELEKLEYENMLLRIENERLKKGYTEEDAAIAKLFNQNTK